MADLYEYGTVKSVPFKVTLSGAGVTGLTFDAADIQISIDSAAFVNASTLGAIAEIGLGWYKWTPSGGASTQASDHIVINVKDNVGTAFDENGVVLYTGGHPSARFAG